MMRIYKKIRSIICFMLFICCLIAGKYNFVSAQEDYLQLIFIHNNPCESCNEVGKFYDLIKEKLNAAGVSGIHYEVGDYYAYSTEGKKQVEDFKERFEIKDEDMFYPVVILGEEYLIGSTQIEENIVALLENGAAALQESAFAETADSTAAETESETASEAGSEIEPETELWESVNETNSFVYIRYFDTFACESCAKADALIESLEENTVISGISYPMTVETRSVAEDNNAQILTDLFEYYNVPENKQHVPILFVGEHYLSGEKEILEELPGLLTSEDALKTTYSKEEGDIQGSNLLDAVGIGGILATGFLNGLNPCSISMTLLFLSLLVSRKRFLPYGLTFLAGKYLAYVTLGIAVSYAASAIPMAVFGLASKIINVILLIFCLILAIGNFLDFIHVRKGEYGKVRVQLPSGLRRFNHNFIKGTLEGKNSKALLPVVFFSSMVVSAGEFFCTGQIYLASILHWVDETAGSGVPVAVFCIYIAMLCLPVLIIVLLLHFGRSAISLSNQALQQMPLIKLLNAVFFAVFAVLALTMLL